MTKITFLTAMFILLFSYTAAADCTPTGDTAATSIFVAAITEPRFCWPAVSGGVGDIVYVIESKTNDGAWIAEGESALPEWTGTRNIGDTVEIRYYACDDVECTGYSAPSQQVNILPNFDYVPDGIVGADDFAVLRASYNLESYAAFRAVFGNYLINGVYSTTWW